MEINSIDVNEFIKVVESRRSVRIFDTTPIPPHVMTSCLDLALLAPNSDNLQPWEFYWVRSPDKKEQLVKACLSQPAARTAVELIVCVARTDTWQSHCHQMVELLSKIPSTTPAALEYYKKAVPAAYSKKQFNFFSFSHKVPFLMGWLNKRFVRVPNTKSQMITWAVKSTALACENLMLALRAYSFDSCPLEGMDVKKVKKILGLSVPGAHVVMVIAAGKRAPQGVYGPRVRFDRENFIKEV